jgi:hypothetical protein
MVSAIAKALFGSQHAVIIGPLGTAKLQEEKPMPENDSFLGAIECRSCVGADGNPKDNFKVRLLDGGVYRIVENDVSRTIERIHGLLCGKVIHISGQIDAGGKAIRLSKVRVMAASKENALRRELGKDEASHDDNWDAEPRMP